LAARCAMNVQFLVDPTDFLRRLAWSFVGIGAQTHNEKPSVALGNNDVNELNLIYWSEFISCNGRCASARVSENWLFYIGNR
jgi:hypothetical protein